MPRVKFDTTVNVGGLLAFVALMVTLMGVGAQLAARMARIETMLDPLWRQYTEGRGSERAGNGR